MAKAIYVKNTKDYSYELEVKPLGAISATFSKVFKPHTVSPNGTVLSNGYTYLTGEEVELIKAGTRYNKYVEKEIFIEYDELPDDALTNDEKYSELLTEVAGLRTAVASDVDKDALIETQAKEIAELKKKLKKTSSSDKE